MSEKWAVVTGATSGIGAQIARRLVSEGAQVIGIGRRADALAVEQKRSEGRFQPIRADLADAKGRAHALEATLALAPRVDVLVNNAGEAAYVSPIELGAARWRALFEINVHAALDLTLGLAPRIPAGGHIINVSSVTARFAANARYGAYAATKGALDYATAALRLELDGRGVHVTSIAPGLVDTPLYDRAPEFATMRETLTRKVPRWLDAHDVADAVAWVLERPPHVVVSELVLLPLGQGR
jgi:NADP-dependent 3-hydroxy acid dehydrogenase YdfG